MNGQYFVIHSIASSESLDRPFKLRVVRFVQLMATALMDEFVMLVQPSSTNEVSMPHGHSSIKPASVRPGQCPKLSSNKDGRSAQRAATVESSMLCAPVRSIDCRRWHLRARDVNPCLVSLKQCDRLMSIMSGQWSARQVKPASVMREHCSTFTLLTKSQWAATDSRVLSVNEHAYGMLRMRNSGVWQRMLCRVLSDRPSQDAQVSTASMDWKCRGGGSTSGSRGPTAQDLISSSCKFPQFRRRLSTCDSNTG
mmetsp:Transcript_35128/g.88391  ORF Transcript_35128/g.88391 Transcript_35128/m.88391 type:complete len:253 (-) Transcript_35128:944-1702(-)